ncbi:MAG: hypothetical protein KGQ38_04335 [Actinomycetales bacterium]|nr:hypothetical protein [Actinomycetales bacterium]
MVSVCVVGEVVLDCVVQNEHVSKVPGGCAANQALALSRFGATVDLRARYSTDENGRFLKNFIAGQGVRVENSIDANEPALVITITKDSAGHPTFNYGELLDCADWQWTEQEISKPLLESCDAILTGSMASVFPPGGTVLLEWATAQQHSGKNIFFDLNIRSGAFTDLAESEIRSLYDQWIAIATVIKVSDEDLLWWAPNESAEVVAAKLSTVGPKLVALTQGPAGVTVFANGQKICQVAAPKVTVADTVGAGDTFFAWLTAGLMELPSDLRFDLDLVTSVLHDAVFASAFNCTKTGCNPPTSAELADFVASLPETAIG